MLQTQITCILSPIWALRSHNATVHQLVTLLLQRSKYHFATQPHLFPMTTCLFDTLRMGACILATKEMLHVQQTAPVKELVSGTECVILLYRHLLCINAYLDGHGMLHRWL